MGRGHRSRARRGRHRPRPPPHGGPRREHRGRRVDRRTGGCHGDAATEATIVAVTITDHLDTAAEAELARAAADGLGEIDSLVDSGVEGAAGAATGDEMRTGGVRWRTFETATAYWSASTGAHLVHARIGAVYTARGGALGRLGLPTSAESGVTDLLDRFRAKPRGRSGLTGWDVLRPTGTLAGSATVLDATDAALHSAVRPRVSDLRRDTASPTTPAVPAAPVGPAAPASPPAPADTPISPVLRGHLSSDLGVRQVRDLTPHQDVPSVGGLAESLRRGEIGAVEASLTRPNVFLRNDALAAAVTTLRPDTRAEALPLADLDTTPDGAGGALARLVSDSERLGADLAVAVGNIGYIVSGPRAQLFQHAIVIVTANAAVELFDEIFAHWLLLGGTRGFLGAPQGSQIDIVGGAYADFGGGRIYWSARTGAHEVHGAILGRYFNVDGTDRALGFPTSDELPINGYPTARMSTFERGIIFWTPEGGARILTGDFLAAWTAAGGVSHYGRPTGEAQTTTRDGIEYRWQVFERGVLLWTEALGCVDQFTVRIARVATGNIDDGYELSGPIPRDDTTAELIVRAWVWVDGAEVLHRESGHGGSSMDLDGWETAPFAIGPDTAVRVRIEAWDWDEISSDDRLAERDVTYRIGDDLWGYTQASGAHLAQPSTANDSDNADPGDVTFDYAIAPVVVSDLTRMHRAHFWTFSNKGRDHLPWAMYKQTFVDIDGDDVNYLTDPLDSWYYDAQYEDVAAGGNCFGFSVSALDAFHRASGVTQPLSQQHSDRVDDDNWQVINRGRARRRRRASRSTRSPRSWMPTTATRAPCGRG